MTELLAEIYVHVQDEHANVLFHKKLDWKLVVIPLAKLPEVIKELEKGVNE